MGRGGGERRIWERKGRRGVGDGGVRKADGKQYTLYNF